MIRLSCNNCAKIYSFPDKDLHPHTLGTDERQMGTETAYAGIIQLDCTSCRNRMTAEFSFWEYPQGALNYKEVDERGCTVIEEPNYLLSYLHDEPEREQHFEGELG